MKSELKPLLLSSIRLNPVALRDVNRDSEAFRQLTDSIRSEGVLSAISVRPVSESEIGEDGKKYILIDGLQRFSASQEAGLSEIPANIINRTESEALVTQVIGNVHRIETKPIEYSRAIIRILGYYPAMTLGELGAKLNKSPQWLEKILKLNGLNDSIKPLVDDGKIPVGNAFSLAKFPDEEQLAWVDRAQTMTIAEFTLKADERQKEIRTSNRQGNTVGPEEFKPITLLRSKKDLESEMTAPVMGPALIRELGILEGTKDKNEAAQRGFKLGIEWTLNFDKKSIEVQKQKDDARRAKAIEDKNRRDAEKQEKRAKDAADLAAKAREGAEAAKAKTTQQSEALSNVV